MMYVLTNNPANVSHKGKALTPPDLLTLAFRFELGARDAVTLTPGWDTGLAKSTRLRVLKTLHDAEVDVRDANQRTYDFGHPLPWEASPVPTMDLLCVMGEPRQVPVDVMPETCVNCGAVLATVPPGCTPQPYGEPVHVVYLATVRP